ncbi:MAG: IS21 family transposase [Deltaproteobacteria bacterium]|nr:IS21 family transposase [Deltaproteobacteria bacterium]
MDIFALRRQGFSFRTIAHKLGIHRETVKKYLQENRPPGELRRENHKESILAPFQQTIEDFLHQDNYRSTWLYNQILKMGYSGGYDTVKNFVRSIKSRLQRQAYIRFETIPGFQAQVDWADFQVIQSSALVLTFYLFIMVLGFSRAIYAELLTSCTMQAFMEAHMRAFQYLGGVPMEILYDNMKHVVTDRKQGKANFNIEFSHFAHHYAFKPLASPPYSPWVKGKVERPVDYIRESFWRGYPFHSLETTNSDLLDWLTQTANCRIHGTYHQGVNIRWDQERPSLNPCPALGYDTSIKVYRKVYKDCMISYNASHYQLPADVVGQKVLLKVKDGSIRFYDDQRLLATYDEAADKGSWVMNVPFTEQLLQSRKQHKTNPYVKVKARATRGLVDGSLFAQVANRPLSFYDQFAQGGASWNN